jgi:hypothetical protein
MTPRSIPATVAWSLPGLTRQSSSSQDDFLGNLMDARVKPAHDAEEHTGHRCVVIAGLDPAIHH